jgi:hypothetical protein
MNESAKKAHRVLDIATHLRKDAERIVKLRRFVRDGNTAEAEESLDRYEEGHVASLIRATMFESIVFACARVTDKAKTERFTIATARALLADSKVFSAIARDGNAAALTEFIVAADKLASNAGMLRLRTLRNYAIVPHLPTNYTKADRAFSYDMENTVDFVLTAVLKLCQGTGVYNVSFDTVDQEWSAPSKAYWGRLLSARQKGRLVV